MGRSRKKQRNLAKKLLRIRRTLGLSQIKLVNVMEIDNLAYNRISEYESGRREPSLSVLLAYARVAGLHLEEIVDDNIELPEKLPGKVRYPTATS